MRPMLGAGEGARPSTLPDSIATALGVSQQLVSKVIRGGVRLGP
jgi:hypothetical protein